MVNEDIIENKKEMKSKKNWIECPNCGYEGEGKKYTKGKLWLEIILWLLGIVPGLIYSLWRLSSRYIGCPKCGYEHVVRESSRAKKRKLALILVGIIVLILIIIVISGGGKEKSIITPEKTTTTPSKTVLKVGQEIKIGDFSLTINSVKVVPRWINLKENWEKWGGKVHYYVVRPKEGYKFVLIEHTETNNGKERGSLDIGRVELVTAEGYKYGNSSYGALGETTTKNLEEEYCKEDELGTLSLLPRESEYGCVGFEVPQDLKPVKILIYKDFFSEEPNIIVNLD